MEGIVKWFNTRKGYGFIKGDDDQEYFVHHSALGQGVFLRDNDKVSFDGVDGEKGKQAQNVKLLQKASEMGGQEAPAEAPQGEEAPAGENEAPATEEAPQEENKEEF